MKINWHRVNHFHKKENWGDVSLVDPVLIYSLDIFRKQLGVPVYISPVEGAVVAKAGHSRKSYHYPIMGVRLCQAADVFPECSLLHAFITAMKGNIFAGIGVYPYWEWEEKELIGGLHLDIRGGTEKTLWWRDKANKYNYFKDIQKTKELFKILIK